jgi:hypothetical protein
MIGLDFSKTSSSSFSSMSSWEETLDLRSSISYSNPEANVSHADSQREAIGSFASAALQYVVVSSCSPSFLVRYSSWKVLSRSRTPQKLGRR